MPNAPISGLARPVVIATAALALSSPALAVDTEVKPDRDGDAAERGAYIALAGGCASCHTAHEGAPYAGGYELATPFGGNLIVPNITPHEETGIGAWSYEDFEGSMRRGVNEEGEPLYPAHPYGHYTLMPDEDVEDLWAYLQTIEPAENSVDIVQLPFPYNVRASLEGWQLLFFEEGRFEPTEGRDDEFNRGKYLVDALGHCGACHTPRNVAGARDEDRYLYGARIHNWYAPDISGRPGSAIEKWDIEELTDYLMADHAALNVPAFGVMWRVSGELAQMEREDIRAISVYLKTRTPDEGMAEPEASQGELPDPGAPVADDRGVAELEDYAIDDGVAGDAAAGGVSVAAGEGVYLSNCVTCHGRDGEGNYGVAASLVGNGGITAAEPLNIISVLLQGIPPRGGYGIMPAYGEILSDTEIAAVSNYIRVAWDNDAPPNADARDVAALRGAVEPVDPIIERAAQCPAVPADHLDARSREMAVALAERGEEGLNDEEAVKALWEAHIEAHPDLTRSERLVALQSAYCLKVAETAETDDDVASRTIGLVMALSPLSTASA
ncbi:MAG: c-type cytochrome, partial [Paracoccaceae bacterium]